MNRRKIRLSIKRIVALALVLTFALSTTVMAVPSLPGSEPPEEVIVIAEDQAEHPVVVTVEPVLIERDGEVVVRADETGVHILQRVLLTQEEIQSLIPLARTALETRMSPHPDRAMTAEELVAWNLEYDTLGGMNQQELLGLYAANEVRIGNSLTPFAVCPALNRAARLHANLITEGHRGATNHDDLFYGPNDPTHGQSARGRVFLFDSFAPVVSAGRPRSFISENTTTGDSGYGAINSWLNSTAGHAGIFSNSTWQDIHVGFGVARYNIDNRLNTRTTMKINAVR